MFTIAVFEVLRCEGRSVSLPSQQGTGSERVKVSVKNQKEYWDFVEIAWKVIDWQA